MEASNLTLAELGWRPFFSNQVSAEESRWCCPVRVMAVHRGMVAIQGEGIDTSISSVLATPGGPEDRPAVGDWLLVDRESQDVVRILDRKNLFKRPQPGDDRRVQLIAANVDTLFIVTSCNQDFSVARIERYLVLAREVRVHPVVVLTKVDLAEAPERFLGAVRGLQPELEVEMINGRDPSSVARLAARCAIGETVALLGSSGVGKSTMINTLRGSDSIATQAVREADGKGRHTTTVREMHRLGRGANGGGWLVDTPGMRELQLSEASSGLAEVFDDIVALTLRCRFTNCTHGAEPECAVQAAMLDGSLDAARYERWCRLTAEETVNTGKMTTRHNRPGKSGRRN
ncbi:ribosome small subunit-dependent GTPase A [Novosphingobium sp. M1R2S20]|uniref:Small ribosomal subunit biogenesis GTPase RsgA n=1 Tax=Novosphingobium rhizovicinum TaxID=3228928 RepID=A0ABV3R679_9SPHN